MRKRDNTSRLKTVVRMLDIGIEQSDSTGRFCRITLNHPFVGLKKKNTHLSTDASCRNTALPVIDLENEGSHQVKSDGADGDRDVE